jgi:hypothetical protein
MEGWRQRRLGWMGTIWKKKKQRRRRKKKEEEEQERKKRQNERKDLTLTGLLMEGLSPG